MFDFVRPIVKLGEIILETTEILIFQIPLLINFSYKFNSENKCVFLRIHLQINTKQNYR